MPESRGAAQNAVFFQAEELAPLREGLELVKDPLYAGGRMLAWHPARKGDRMQIPIPVPEDGAYRLTLTLVCADDAGIISSEFDGENIGLGSEKGIINLHEPYRTTLRNFGSGEDTLELRYEGHDADAGDMIGIDFVWVQKRG